MKKNKGYTLIEMLIVIAIIAIVSGMAFVTVGIIYQAKCDAAIDTFNSQIDSLWIKTKALSQGKTQSDPNTSEAKSIYPMCMLLKKNTDAGDDVKDGSYELILGFEDGSAFTQKEVATVLTNLVSFRYTPSDASQKHASLTKDAAVASGDVLETNEEILIEFNKSDGSVKYGAGTYDIIYRDKVMGTIYLDAMTGNHYIK